MTAEIWRDIPGYPGYKASNQGCIGSRYARKGAGNKMAVTSGIVRILKPDYDRQGYARVRLYEGGRGRIIKVATLVMLAFHGPRPEGLEVCHGDNDPSNDCLGNLRYDTHSANMQESILSNRDKRKLTLEQARMARIEYAEGCISQAALAKKNGISPRPAWLLLHGLTYTDAGGPILNQ